MEKVATVEPMADGDGSTMDTKLSPKNTEDRDTRIRELAYLKWMAATGGTVVGQEASEAFWLEAEKEIDAGA